MIYPVSVIGIAVIIVGCLLKFVVPIFINLFASLQVDLPLPTRIVMGLSYVVGRFWWVMFLGIGALVFGVGQMRKTEKGRLIWTPSSSCRLRTRA